MTWIDNQDDYFLRDYKDQDKPSTPAPGTDAAQGSQEASAPRPQEGGSEFSFTGGSESTPPHGHAGYPGPESPRRRRRRLGARWAMFLLMLAAAGAVMAYIHWWVPVASDKLVTGYVTSVERRGIFFKTFEGDMITSTLLTDTTRIYRSDLRFSIPDDSVARLVQACQGTGRPVTLVTSRYRATLPWRGSQPVTVTGIEQ